MGKKVEEPKPKAKTLLGNSALLDAMNDRVKNDRVKNWPKNVFFLAKLPSIRQPVMEKRAPRKRSRPIIDVADADRVQYAMELAELSFEEIMKS